MSQIVDPRNVSPKQLKSGDVLIRSVTCHIEKFEDGTILAKLYVAEYPGEMFEGIPPGPRIGVVASPNHQVFPVLRELFPTVANAIVYFNGHPDLDIYEEEDISEFD